MSSLYYHQQQQQQQQQQQEHQQQYQHQQQDRRVVIQQQQQQQHARAAQAHAAQAEIEVETAARRRQHQHQQQQRRLYEQQQQQQQQTAQAAQYHRDRVVQQQHQAHHQAQAQQDDAQQETPTHTTTETKNRETNIESSSESSSEYYAFDGSSLSYHNYQSYDEICRILLTMIQQENSNGTYDLNQYFPLNYSNQHNQNRNDGNQNNSRDNKQQQRIRKRHPQRKLQVQNVIPNNYIWREKICVWLYNVVDHFNLPREIVCISLNYFDRFMATLSTSSNSSSSSSSDSSSDSSDSDRDKKKGQSSRPSCAPVIDPNNILRAFRKSNDSTNISCDDLALLTGLTVIYLSSKLHLSNNQPYDSLNQPLVCGVTKLQKITQPISLSTLAGLSRGLFSQLDIITMETILLKSLHWKLHPPTLHSYISLMLRLIPTTEGGELQESKTTGGSVHISFIEDLYTTSIFVAELGICDSFYVQQQIPLYIIAFASIYICIQDILILNDDDGNGVSLENTGCFTKYKRDIFVNAICNTLGIFGNDDSCDCDGNGDTLHQRMFQEACIRLRHVYSAQSEDAQDQADPQKIDAQEKKDAPVATTATIATADQGIEIEPLKGPATVPTTPHRHSQLSSSNCSPTSATDMSMSTINSAMMSHSIADTRGGGGGGGSGDVVVVKRSDSMVSSIGLTRGLTRGESMVSSMSVGDGIGDNDNDNDNHNGDLVRGESMVSTMSGGYGYGYGNKRGESMVSSMSVGDGDGGCYERGGGRRDTASSPFDCQDHDGDNDDVDVSNMLRYSPSPPHDLHAHAVHAHAVHAHAAQNPQDMIEVVGIPHHQNQNQQQHHPDDTNEYIHHEYAQHYDQHSGRRGRDRGSTSSSGRKSNSNSSNSNNNEHHYHLGGGAKIQHHHYYSSIATSTSSGTGGTTGMNNNTATTSSSSSSSRRRLSSRSGSGGGTSNIKSRNNQQTTTAMKCSPIAFH